jgi:hypothetical protein
MAKDDDKKVANLERKLGRLANVIYSWGMTHNDMHLVEMVKGAMDDDDDDAVDDVPSELDPADDDDDDEEEPAPPPPKASRPRKVKPKRGVA